MGLRKLRIHSLRQIVQVVTDDRRVLKGAQMKELAILNSEKNDLTVIVDR